MSVIDPRRRRDLAAIHVMAKQLGMDAADKNPESEYRSMLFMRGRVRSSKELDYTGLQQVKEHLQERCKAMGIRVPAGRGSRVEGRGRPRPAPDKAAQVGKVRALLNAGRAIGLAWSDEYADGTARKMFHVDKYEWCQAPQLRGLIAALAKQLARERAKRAV